MKNISKRNIVVRLILLLTVVSTTSFAEGKIVGGKQSIHPDWFKESFLDIAEDVEEAAEGDRHIILFMHLNDCPYCHKMVEDNFKNSEMSSFIQNNFDVIAINIKGDREVAFNEKLTVTEKRLAKMVKVRYTPTILFLSKNNEIVLRINGYRSARSFAHALNFVKQQQYKKMVFADFIEAEQVRQQSESESGNNDYNYKLRDHILFENRSNLQQVAQQPLALLFEDSNCDACNKLHDGHLKNPKIISELKNFKLVRLDAASTKAIIDIDGNQTTAQAYAKKLGLSYRPGIVLIDEGREIARIDGLLYSYHFREILRYVGERFYKSYPENFYDYLSVRTKELLKAGETIDLSK